MGSAWGQGMALVSTKLTNAEQYWARLLAEERTRRNRQAGVVNARQGPQTDEQTDLNGVGGEWAFCKAANVWPDLTTDCRRGGYDCLVKGWRVDVKTTEYETGRLLATLKTSPADQDIFVLMVGAFPGPYRIAGWAWAEELLAQETITDLGRGPGHVLRQAQLAPWEGFPPRRSDREGSR